MRLFGQHMHQEQVQAQSTGQRLDPDFRRVEPVHAFTTVEQHLQADQRQCEGAKTKEVERRRLRGFLLGEQQRYDQEDVRRQRQADVEDRTPVEMLGDPATDARAADDAHEHDGGPGRAELHAFLGRQRLHGNRHRQRRQHTTRQALNNACADELQRRAGNSGQQQTEHEERQRRLIHKLQAKAPGKPLGNRHGDRACRQVRGENPARLVVGHRQAALNQPQYCIGQRQVRRLHVSREQNGQPERARTACIRGCICMGVH
ncbi:hypothetical protein D3C87_1085440 [compost metagenome]